MRTPRKDQDPRTRLDFVRALGEHLGKLVDAFGDQLPVAWQTALTVVAMVMEYGDIVADIAAYATRALRRTASGGWQWLARRLRRRR